MKVCIVNYEQGMNNGILTKFAVKLDDELKKMGINSWVYSHPDSSADVNHHINYLPYKNELSPKTVNTLMVTHIWDGYKFDALKKGMKTADAGICMSHETQEILEEKGIQKLTTILPAHDGKPRRFQVVAILTNVYPDGCKMEGMFTELVKTLDLKQWAFRIMGSGWHDLLVPLVADGLQVDYFHEFNPEIHQKILESSDYALYFGEDEGSMGLLDAVNAGLKVIGKPQGFHKEMKLDFEFSNQEELNKIFKKLSKNRVKDWTWGRYAKEHLELWKGLLKK